MAIKIEKQDDLYRPIKENVMRRYIYIKEEGELEGVFYKAPSPYTKHNKLIELAGINIRDVKALGYIHEFKPNLIGLDTLGSIEPPIASTMSAQEVLEAVLKLPKQNRELKLIAA